MAVNDLRIFVLLFDPVKAATKKPKNVKLFGRNYALDGSSDLIRANLQFGKFDLEKGETMLGHEDGVEWGYCMLLMVSFFLDYFVTQDLLDDQRALDDFKIWFENLVVGWAMEQGLQAEVLREKPNEFWRKIIIKGFTIQKVVSTSNT